MPPDTTVSDLAQAILATDEAHAHGLANDAALALYITPVDSHQHGQVAWLPQSMLSLLDEALVQDHGIRLYDSALLLQSHDRLGGDFEWRVGDIHVVAVAINDGPPAKRARTLATGIPVTRPNVLLGRFCVPLDTIDAFRDVQAALTLRERQPVVLLSGPPLSGKTTMANSVERWQHDCVFASVQERLLVSNSNMWIELGNIVNADEECTGKAAFVRACAELPTIWFLIVDNFQRLLACPTLASQFLDALRELRELPNFGGFLGVGLSNDAMQSLPRECEDLFSKDAVVHTKPFSTQQMAALFQQVRPAYRFTDSLQHGLMAYSGGSPGILGSLITVTATNVKKHGVDFTAWKDWFETRGFAAYVETSGEMFAHLRDEWLELTKSEWRWLASALESQQSALGHIPAFLRLSSVNIDYSKADERLRELTADEHDHDNEDLSDYDRMCRRIRRLFLRIIVDFPRTSTSSSAKK